MTIQIRCECGVVVQGKSEKHLIHNLKEHKESQRHKFQMESIKKINKE
jgi:hypothetical protein